LTAIAKVVAGGVYFTPAIAGGLIRGMTASDPARAADRISPRQTQVLQLLSQGMRMKEIAAELQLSRRTVETHKYEMMESLGVRSAAQLVRFAISRRLIVDDNRSLQ
jgi:DNA-binding NarL/FixJ family response regulator